MCYRREKDEAHPPGTKQSAICTPDKCVVCLEPAVIECGCCPRASKVCDRACLLRHTEGRYEVPIPDEKASEYERVCAFGEKDDYIRREQQKSRASEKIKLEIRRASPPEESLVVVAPYDGIGGARIGAPTFYPGNIC